MADFKHIVRIVNTDLDGHKPIVHSLTKIKGIGKVFANSICLIADIEKMHKTGELSELQVKKLNEIISDPKKYNFPNWLFNRRKEYVSGEDKHLLSSDLDFVQSNHLRRLQRIKSYRGIRLAKGLPVRGQRTRSNFRRNKGKVMGVKRKSGKK